MQKKITRNSIADLRKVGPESGPAGLLQADMAAVDFTPSGAVVAENVRDLQT